MKGFPRLALRNTDLGPSDHAYIIALTPSVQALRLMVVRDLTCSRLLTLDITRVFQAARAQPQLSRFTSSFRPIV